MAQEQASRGVFAQAKDVMNSVLKEEKEREVREKEKKEAEEKENERKNWSISLMDTSLDTLLFFSVPFPSTTAYHANFVLSIVLSKSPLSQQSFE